MAAAGHIQALLLLMALLCPARTQPAPAVLAQVNHDVVLPCDRVLPGQQRCDRTTWIYWNPAINGPTQGIVSLGKINPDVRKDHSRFSLTESCSLAIKRVQVEDAGIYSCKQFGFSGREVSANEASLSVVTVTERSDQDEVALSCRVSSPYRCSFLPVKWLHNHADLTSASPYDGFTSFPCGAILSFPQRLYHNRDQFTCEVTHGDNKYEYEVRSEPSEVAPTERPTATPGANCGESQEFTGWWWFLVLKSVSWGVLICITVIVSIYTRERKKPREADGNMVMSPGGNPRNAADYVNQQ